MARHSYLLHGDCRSVLPRLADGCVRLCVTSPPYAEQRASTAIPPDEYVDWFLPIANEIQRVLAPNGSFVLNIKEHRSQCQRHPYVFRLVLALVERGWRRQDTFIWAKKNYLPGRWPRNLSDAWEYLFHFTRRRHFVWNPDAVRVPVSEETRRRRASGAINYPLYGERRGRRRLFVDSHQDTKYPSNVLHLPTVCQATGHDSPYPLGIPEFFIRLLTDEGDVVLDPFAGSGTTGAPCRKLNRRFVLIERRRDFVAICERRLGMSHQSFRSA